MNDHNLKPWPKGTSGNPKGRKRKLYNDINLKLKEDGYEPITKAELVEAYQIIFNLDKQAIEELKKQKDLPYSFLLILKSMKDPRVRQDLRDWAMGKAMEEIHSTMTVQPIYPDLEPVKRDEEYLLPDPDEPETA